MLPVDDVVNEVNEDLGYAKYEIGDGTAKVLTLIQKDTLPDDSVSFVLNAVRYYLSRLDIKHDVTARVVDYIKTGDEKTDIMKNIAGNLQTACYDPENREIVVISGGRNLVDVIRSIAHELIHVDQHDNGRLETFDIPLKISKGDAGWKAEYEAYGLSGILTREFRAIMNDGDEPDFVYQVRINAI